MKPSPGEATGRQGASEAGQAATNRLDRPGALEGRQAGHSGTRLSVRPMGPEDLPAFLDLIDALADYEHLERPDPAARKRLASDATADPARFHVLLAERAGRVVGYAVYFYTYSTFLARPTLYLEDIFVREEERCRGAGNALMEELAQEALRQDCGRMEWQVLTWNQPSIEFYERRRARRLDDWYTYRLTADQLSELVGE